MHLVELLEQHAQRASHSVPDWMLGCFKRRSISFANGQTDTRTHVLWLQSRNITIDLRLPVASEQLPAKSPEDYSAKELRALANYEGWYAESLWQNDVLSWSGGTSFQTHNRWPEPAILNRVGDCMMEFSPDATYVEDWRIQSLRPGPLAGLRLTQERDLDTGRVRHRDGALIINGHWAGLVLGRAFELPQPAKDAQLRDLLSVVNEGGQINANDKKAFLQKLFNFETSVGLGDCHSGYKVAFTTCPKRKGEALFNLEGFEFDAESNEVIHAFEEQGAVIERRFTIDTLEPHFAFSGVTGFTPAASQWFEFEQETLGRYLEALSIEPLSS